jgi:hypothetical protein
MSTTCQPNVSQMSEGEQKENTIRRTKGEQCSQVKIYKHRYEHSFLPEKYGVVTIPTVPEEEEYNIDTYSSFGLVDASDEIAMKLLRSTY